MGIVGEGYSEDRNLCEGRREAIYTFYESYASPCSSLNALPLFLA